MTDHENQSDNDRAPPNYGWSAQPPPNRELMLECSHGETSNEFFANFPVFWPIRACFGALAHGFDADSVFGLYAPAGTPTDVIARVNREINRILSTQALKDRILNLGGEALPLTPAEFGARANDDSKRFGEIIRERKIVGD